MGLQRWIKILINDLVASINKLDAIINLILEINDEFLKKITEAEC